MSIRHAQAIWNGSLREGNGSMAFGAGESAYRGPYSHGSRFAEEAGTNPEELIGAALAGCFSMALAADLSRAGHIPVTIQSEASVHLERVDGSPTITRIVLTTDAEVEGVSESEFFKIAESAKDNCPVSRALGSVQVELEATLTS
jgi:osmotically inducible protein OsmC